MRNLIHTCRPLLRNTVLLFIFLSGFHSVSGQISHGGHPLPLYTGTGVRAFDASSDFFVEMPAFDADAALRQTQQERSDFRSLEFAHKFYPFLRPDNSGVSFVEGNLKVWRVGIRSKGAYSLNILFSKYRLPQGAKVFVYSPDQTEILGSFTEENNSELNLLPVQPIGGEELIVEYQEPLDASFEGEIEIGEVNHDFTGLFRSGEPGVTWGDQQSCHPNLLCYPEDAEAGSGVVVLVIDGTTACTGVLVNNTNEDGTPYLLTATHCLNKNYSSSFLANRKYDLMAGSIVAFFNFDSPVCDPWDQETNTDIMGPLQMTMASADSVLISETHDISLLKLKETPPAEYQPYYLGWNAEASPSGDFHGIHHPSGGIKKVAVEEDRLGTGSFDSPNPNYPFEPSSFWVVKAWDVAATEGGSSGSPLLDGQKRVIGTLTGGVSMCSSPKGPDSYASLNKFWEVEGSLENPNSISHYLDPAGTGNKQLGGLNPYSQNPYTRSNNFKSDDSVEYHEYQSVAFFTTNNTFGYTEFAEEFHATTNLQLQGVFLASPAISNIASMDIRIRVYSGENEPERLLYEQPYSYNYQYFHSSSLQDASRNMKYSLENYVRFEEPVRVSGTFYISYFDANGITPGFASFNVSPRKVGSGLVSTAWMKNSTGWVRSSENIENPINTALFITPYVIGTGSTTVEPEKEQPQLTVYHSNSLKRIFIESNYELVEWDIYYSSGIKVHHETTDISLNRTSYSSAHLPKGVYIVRVKTADGTVSSKKVIVI